MSSAFKKFRYDLTGPFPDRMHASDATGFRLALLGQFGADLIHFPPGGSVPAHTHPGDHYLFVTHGEGCVVIDNIRHHISQGFGYLVPGNVIHSVEAAPDSPLTLLVVANRYIDVSSEERLELK